MTAEELIGSAVVAAVISGATSYLVARATAGATVRSAEITAETERSKLAEDERKEGRAAFIAAVEAWDMSRLPEVKSNVRHARVREARRCLIEVGAIQGPAVRTSEFDELVTLLAANDVDSERAAAIWPEVERQIMQTLPRSEVRS